MTSTKLYTNTTSALLMDSLKTLMKMDELKRTRLVGGTSLSLQLGHRKSVDIDLFFPSSEYGQVDFNGLEFALRKRFDYVDCYRGKGGNEGFGKGFYIGPNTDELIKLDIYICNEPFIRNELIIDEIRFARIEDIAAMKLGVITNGGRKKDFWDIHELLETNNIETMIGWWHEMHPYANPQDVTKGLLDFSYADDEVNPECLRGKFWELIKEDLTLAVLK